MKKTNLRRNKRSSKSFKKPRIPQDLNYRCSSEYAVDKLIRILIKRNAFNYYTFIKALDTTPFPHLKRIIRDIYNKFQECGPNYFRKQNNTTEKKVKDFKQSPAKKKDIKGKNKTNQRQKNIVKTARYDISKKHAIENNILKIDNPMSLHGFEYTLGQTIILNWDWITFGDNKIYFQIPFIINCQIVQTKFIIYDEDSCKYYNSLKEFFKRKQPDIRCSYDGDTLILKDSIKIMACINTSMTGTVLDTMTLKEIESLNRGDEQSVNFFDLPSRYHNYLCACSCGNYTAALIKERSESIFFDYLCNQQHKSYRIVPLNEMQSFESSLDVFRERAFMFTLSARENKVVIILENYNDNRATICFKVSRDRHKEAIKNLYALFQSNESNKRSKVKCKKYDLAAWGIIHHESINHENYITWRYNIDSMRI